MRTEIYIKTEVETVEVWSIKDNDYTLIMHSELIWFPVECDWDNVAGIETACLAIWPAADIIIQ